MQLTIITSWKLNKKKLEKTITNFVKEKVNLEIIKQDKVGVQSEFDKEFLAKFENIYHLEIYLKTCILDSLIK